MESVRKLFENLKKRRNEKKMLQRKMHLEFHKRVDELYRENKEFQKRYRHIRNSRLIITFVGLVLFIFIFEYFGIKRLSVIFAAIIFAIWVLELIFLITLEKRVLKPITDLQRAVVQISNGNYDVKVENDMENKLSMLIYSFNDMAEKLKEGERIKAEYEENRKNLIANISHDLKTPITSIQGYIETLQEVDNVPKETVKKYYEIIHNNTTYINRLIDDLFLFSKLDIQKLDFNFQNTEIKAFMEDLMQEFSFELEDRNIKFQYRDLITEKRYVKIDGKRINQVFRNIIGNAEKYASSENLLIQVTMEKLQDKIYINIRDNGPGIPKEKLDNIFNRFYRIDNERTKDLMSTGLGLAIAKELVEAQGGEIKVSSTLNKGSCFTIILPILRKEFKK